MIKVRLWGVMLGCILGLGKWGYADVVILKSGLQKEGVVIKEDKQEICIMLEDKSEIYRRSKIEKIEFDTMKHNFYIMAKIYEAREMWDKALQYYRYLYREDKNDIQVREDIERVVLEKDRRKERLMEGYLAIRNEIGGGKKKVVKEDKKSDFFKVFGFRLKRKEKEWKVVSVIKPSTAYSYGVRPKDKIECPQARGLETVKELEEYMLKQPSGGFFYLYKNCKVYKVKRGLINKKKTLECQFDIQKHGIYIDKVIKDGSAWVAGLRDRDKLVRLAYQNERYLNKKEVESIIAQEEDVIEVQVKRKVNYSSFV